jgi:formylglycine-generating enzyme required for sulfatase activity
MGRYEVTRGEYFRVMGEAGPMHDAAELETERDRFPVTGITWDEAAQFCKRLTELDAEREAGRRYRMPTEAEWEYACRSSSIAPYEWLPQRRPGDQTGEAAGILPPLPLVPVGSYPANGFGLHDMRGNAWEWTADWFDRDYYAYSPKIDPPGPSAGFLKVVRGGDWRFVGEPCHIDYSMLPRWKGNPFVGFRVVCEATDG